VAETPIGQARAGGPQPFSLRGGIPAQRRELGTQGRERVRKLLEAALIEFEERGFHAVRVDDVVRRAQSSHGTFYLYFSSKEDVFKALLRDALHEITVITGEFPVVTGDRASRAALRDWVQRFCDLYAAYAPVMRVLGQADSIGEEVWGDGLQALFALAEAIATGMTAGRRQARVQRAELTAIACVMMLERVNYLLSAGVRLPRADMVDKLSSIIDAAFELTPAASRDSEPTAGDQQPAGIAAPPGTEPPDGPPGWQGGQVSA
jgi:AcrR family transcriptional regulator